MAHQANGPKRAMKLFGDFKLLAYSLSFLKGSSPECMGTVKQGGRYIWSLKMQGVGDLYLADNYQLIKDL